VEDGVALGNEDVGELVVGNEDGLDPDIAAMQRDIVTMRMRLKVP
jgi:hypothetical protein